MAATPETVKTPLLQEAETMLAALPRGGIKKFAEQLGWSEGRVKQIAKGMRPTGSRRIGSGDQQVQRVVYELRRMANISAGCVNAANEPMNIPAFLRNQKSLMDVIADLRTKNASDYEIAIAVGIPEDSPLLIK